MKRIEHPWLRLRNKKYISPIVSPSSECPIWQISQITLNKPRTPGLSNIIPSGKHTKNYGKSPLLMGKSTINGPFSIAMLVYQRVIFSH